MKENKGAFATQSGHTLESIVITVLQAKGFQVVQYNKYIKTPEKFGDEILIRNVPYTTIYNHPGKTEFLLSSKKYNLKLRIECKWQQVAGSVDEKLPYLYLNCIEKIPETDILIIVDGAGAKKGPVQWLKSVCNNRLYVGQDNMNKNITVMSTAEFMAWANIKFR